MVMGMMLLMMVMMVMVMKVLMKMMAMMMKMTVMMVMIRKKLSHRCFWRNIDCCARGGLFQAVPEDGGD